MDEHTGADLTGQKSFDKACETNSLAEVSKLLFGGDSDEELCREAEVRSGGDKLVGEFLRSKGLSACSTCLPEEP